MLIDSPVRVSSRNLGLHGEEAGGGACTKWGLEEGKAQYIDAQYIFLGGGGGGGGHRCQLQGSCPLSRPMEINFSTKHLSQHQ